MLGARLGHVRQARVLARHVCDFCRYVCEYVCTVDGQDWRVMGMNKGALP